MIVCISIISMIIIISSYHYGRGPVPDALPRYGHAEAVLHAYLRDKDLYTTTNKCLQCLIKIMYTVF